MQHRPLDIDSQPSNLAASSTKHLHRIVYADTVFSLAIVRYHSTCLRRYSNRCMQCVHNQRKRRTKPSSISARNITKLWRKGRGPKIPVCHHITDERCWVWHFYNCYGWTWGDRMTWELYVNLAMLSIIPNGDPSVRKYSWAEICVPQRIGNVHWNAGFYGNFSLKHDRSPQGQCGRDRSIFAKRSWWRVLCCRSVVNGSPQGL